MYKLSLLALLLTASHAKAMEFVNVSAGYNIRIGPSSSSARLRPPLKRATTGTLLAERGNWRKVCLGGLGTVCEGGTQGWVYMKAVSPAKDEAMPKERRETRKTTCVGGECARKPRETIPAAVKPIVKAIEDEPRGPQYQLPRGFDKACATFLGPDGLGKWGKAMVSAAKRVAPDCFYERNFYGSICPNYSRLPKAQKNAMIAMTFAAIAQTESHCRPWARNPNGTNDVADGMFQLEATAAFRARQRRDPRWCKTREDIDSQRIDFQSECSVSTIDKSICGKFGSYIFDSKGYWQELKNEREITRRIRKTARDMRLCVKAAGSSSSDDDDD